MKNVTWTDWEIIFNWENDVMDMFKFQWAKISHLWTFVFSGADLGPIWQRSPLLGMRKLVPKKTFSCEKQTCICYKKTLIYIKVSLLHFSGSLLCN